MTKVDLTVTGGDHLSRAFDELNAETKAAIAKVNNAIGLELRGDIVRRYNSGPATGRVYKKYKPDRIHRASAADEAPMTDTGTLAGGMIYKEVSDKSVMVGNTVFYAPILEFALGRPAWVPAIEAITPKYRRLLQTAIDRFMP